MKQSILLFLCFLLFANGYTQRILLDNQNSERIAKACHLIKMNAPDIYESVVIHSIIQRFGHPGDIFHSTYNVDGNDIWILIGQKSLTERSINRLAGTIFHESLHLLLSLQRKRLGKSWDFSDLSENERKQEEIFVYKRTRELLVRLNTSSWEIEEYDRWASAYY
jgi:hypothetical protein